MIIGVDGNEANVEKRVGSNQYAFELLHALHDLPESKKHEFVIYLRSNPLPDMPQLSTWWKYKVFGPKRLWTQIALPVALISGRQKPKVFFSPGHYRPRWSPVPTVISIMDLGYLRFPDQFTKRDLVQLKTWTSHSIRKANHILTISESTKRDVIEFYDIPEERITVTYPGYDEGRFNKKIKDGEVQKVKGKYGITDDYILFLSTLKPSKNIEGLLKAFSHLTANDLRLVIAGKKGWMWEEIFKKVRDLNLQDKTIFTDFVDEEDVPALMKGAKVFVLPSFWEGFGIPIVEAMAVGTPIVASNVGSLPEVVGSAGVLVDPNNTKEILEGIKKVLRNREVYVRRGLEQVELFDWKKTAKLTLQVLENA